MADASADLAKATADISLTSSGREVLDRAAALATARGATQTDPVDVLKAILESRGTLAAQSIRELGGDPANISAQLMPPDGTAGLPIRQLLVNANREAGVLGHYQVDSIHLLLAMLYSDTPATSAALQKAGLTLYDLRRHIQTAAKPSFAGDPRSARPPDAALRRRPLPPLRGVVTVSPVFLGLLALTVGSGALLYFEVVPAAIPILTVVFITAGWITSVCVHEFGHALVAYLGGDRSVVGHGYLTLNPLLYTSMFLSIVMPIAFLLLGGIALPGAAVYINRSALRSNVWDSAVSIAGPAGTAVCGLLIAIPFLVPGHLGWMSSHLSFFAALAFLGFIEAFAMVLNLLPIPGLDGFGVIRPWLPYAAQDLANTFGQSAIFIVFIVLWFVPSVSQAFFNVVAQVSGAAGIDPGLISLGQAQMPRLR
ncbi:MAG TPA: Clp protease N-terminal domain-containing protein [Candidatus Acidoferrum sp.]|jgi:Zn-dependent protease|nr:Clp protease N-terminal domain-containing protein [Candidatus Acidoferrum sp.]